MSEDKLSAEEVAESILVDYGRTEPEAQRWPIEISRVAEQIEAYASRWRERAEQHKAELAKLERKAQDMIDTLEAEVKRLYSELDAGRERAERAERDVEAWKEHSFNEGNLRAKYQAEVERLRKELAAMHENFQLGGQQEGTNG